MRPVGNHESWSEGPIPYRTGDGSGGGDPRICHRLRSVTEPVTDLGAGTPGNVTGCGRAGEPVADLRSRTPPDPGDRTVQVQSWLPHSPRRARAPWDGCRA